MGLRLVDGVSRCGVEPIDEAGAAAMVHRGLLVDDGPRLRRTPAGRPLAGGVTLRLLVA
ncbi:MAG TPA: hypothetical protein VG452_09125 [Egibacteraceae bacterium]|nr:hypothetical protein [Egibacteraceae bacterium]